MPLWMSTRLARAPSWHILYQPRQALAATINVNHFLLSEACQ